MVWNSPGSLSREAALTTPPDIPPQVLLRAYAAGIFPMAESRDDPAVYWIDPEMRGVMPLDAFHLPRSLRRTLRRGPFTVRCDTAFDRVIGACAESARGREETWINATIERAYGRLHQLGFVHSVETWLGDDLVGGLYGVSLGGAFFGESMFSRRTDASKVALAHLVARLRLGGFKLLDTQFVTEHLKRFGAIEIPAREYQRRLDAALPVQAAFYSDVPPEVLDGELESIFRQSRTQRS